MGILIKSVFVKGVTEGFPGGALNKFFSKANLGKTIPNYYIFGKASKHQVGVVLNLKLRTLHSLRPLRPLNFLMSHGALPTLRCCTFCMNAFSKYARRSRSTFHVVHTSSNSFF